MDRSAIERFASSARTQLMRDVEHRLHELGLSRDASAVDPSQVTLDGKLLSPAQLKQRSALADRLRSSGHEQAVEQAAYTWFNRFAALRFMEVNGYLPGGLRVLSAAGADPRDARVRPDIIRLATSALPVDENLVREMRMASDDEALYRYLLMVQCAELSSTLPFLFEPLEGWTELLFPRDMLSEGSVARRMVAEIPEEDWLEQVEIVGWLYQYYISERKDQVYAGFKKGRKASKNDIPPATQLFTPSWIVRYMMDNSLGRLWLESRPQSELRPRMEYYIDEAEQDPEVRAELESLTRKNVDPSQVTVIDPACGSGHILVYTFDLLYEMYLEAGYPATDIPRMVLERNLYGLDIDERASQLASFALMMKAREKDPQIFAKGIRPHVLAIKESNAASREIQAGLLSIVEPADRPSCAEALDYLVRVFHDASEYGSLVRVDDMGFSWISQAATELRNAALEAGGAFRLADGEILGLNDLDNQIDLLLALVRQAQVMAGKYDVVVTNPPYLGDRNMNITIKAYLQKHYRDEKGNLFAAFMARCLDLCGSACFFAAVTMNAWMFLSSFEVFRERLLKQNCIVSLLDMDNNVMRIAFQTVATVWRTHAIPRYRGTYFYVQKEDLIDDRPTEFPVVHRRFAQRPYGDFYRIPGSPIAYWASENMLMCYDKGQPLRSLADCRVGMTTGDNDRFLRAWHEIEIGKVGLGCSSRADARGSGKRWFPYRKGGPYRKWYGNNEHVVDWGDDGYLIRSSGRAYPRAMKYYFRPGITWTDVSSSRFGVRFSEEGFLFDASGNTLFMKEASMCYLALAFLCSTVAERFLEFANSTMHFQTGDVASLPFIEPDSDSVRCEVETLARSSVSLARADWDSSEASWDFSRHPLLAYGNGTSTVEEAFERWGQFAEGQFQQMKRNEEEINRLFIQIYGLEDEMSPEVPDDCVTIRRADKDRDVRSFISYAVGCMMGRYSLDVEGLAYAGGQFDWSKYRSFVPDRDGVIPVLDDDYFADDIVDRFVEFVKVCFGSDTLEKNMNWIADSLGRRSGETSRDAIRRYFTDDFYRDHLKAYSKRPIYWMFSSGKQKGFGALVYMHRYQRDTVALVRTKYLLELESRMDARLSSLRKALDSDIPGVSKSQLTRSIVKLERQLAELRAYDEPMHSLADDMVEIDLDDGVVANYAKFESVLEAIR